MIKLEKFIVFISILLTVTSATAQFVVEAMSKDELKPWCDNKIIWGDHNISSEQCLKVAVPCSVVVASKKLSFSEANDELYRCTYEGLGIDIPKYFSDKSVE